MTTDRIPTGYPRLDALLGGGLRADTLTGVLYEDNEACRDAANKLYNALGKRSGGMLDWYSTQGAPDPSVVKRDAAEQERVAIIAGPTTALMASNYHFLGGADVILTIRGTHDRTVITAEKNRFGKCDAVAFRWRAGVLNDVEAIDLSRREPEALDPVAAERARWAEAMGDVADDLTRHADSCQTLIDVGGGNPSLRVEGKRAAYAHAAELLRAAIADAKATP